MLTASKYPIFFLFLFISFPLIVCGQFNIKVGYSGYYQGNEVVNGLIDGYNDANTFLDDPLDKFHLHHGMELGVRYSVGPLALELSWATGSADSEASGTDPLTLATVDTKLYSSQRHYALGLENRFGWFSFGGTLGYHLSRIRKEVSDSGVQNDLVDEKILSSRFFISLEAKGEHTSFVIRPFVEMPWEKANFYGLKAELLPDPIIITPPTDTSAFHEKPFFIGLSLLFYNGPN